MIDIKKAARSSLLRWNARAAAEAKTPYVVEHKRGYKHPRLMRLGQLRVMDWGDGPRVDFGGGIIYGLSVLNEMRIPTDKDAEAIAAAQALIISAQEYAERVQIAAFKRGRAPTIAEVRAASEQVRAEVPD